MLAARKLSDSLSVRGIQELLAYQTSRNNAILELQMHVTDLMVTLEVWVQYNKVLNIIPDLWYSGAWREFIDE